MMTMMVIMVVGIMINPVFIIRMARNLEDRVKIIIILIFIKDRICSVRIFMMMTRRNLLCKMSNRNLLSENQQIQRKSLKIIRNRY